ncbi:MAG: threonyl-tRNA synthetase, partial [Bacteroidota bacterium]
MIKITLPDGKVLDKAVGTTPMDVAKGISEGLARNVLAAKFNGQVIDSSSSLAVDGSLELLTWDSTEGKSTFWHSSAHLMAEALEFHFPGIKFGIGPPVENGFYYDVDPGDTAISSEDFKKIEEKMLELARQANPFVRKEVSKSDAIDYFTVKG